MKRINLVLLVATLASLVASAALAGPRATRWEVRRIERREALQHARIAQGRRRGDLSRGEVARLRAGQWRVHRMERRALADGRISRLERRRIERAQDRENRAIDRLRHNRWRA